LCCVRKILKSDGGEPIYLYRNFANPQVVASKKSTAGDRPSELAYSVSLWPYPFTALSKTRSIFLFGTHPLTATAVLAFTNQMLQTSRIYLFTRNKTLVGFLVVSSLAACGTGVAAAIEAWIFHKWVPPYRHDSRRDQCHRNGTDWPCSSCFSQSLRSILRFNVPSTLS
jgi:hypothetical protein